MAESEIEEGGVNAGAALVSVAPEATVATAAAKRGMATIIGAHTIQHVYVNGFYAMVPTIYKQLGLVPIQAGIMDSVRWVSSGGSGIFVGFVVDMFRHRRGFFLGLSMVMLAGGYMLVSLAPSYGFIMLALVFAHIGSAMWHPPGIGLISEAFPKRRGLLISMHRSSGSVGDTLGPVLVGFLLVVITWKQVCSTGFLWQSW